MRRLATTTRLLLLALAVAVVLAGCGSGGSQSAQTLLDQGFRHPIHSANVTIDVQGTLLGARNLQGPVDIKVNGPYQSNGAAKLPSFAWAVSVAGAGSSFTGALTSTGDRLYLGLGRDSYDLGPVQVARFTGKAGRSLGESLRAYGIDLRSWVAGASVEGGASVAGVDTTHVRAGVDVPRVLADLNRAIARTAGRGARGLSPTQVGQAERVVGTPSLDIYVGKADGTIRRVSVGFELNVPAAQRAQYRGLSGGTLRFSVEFADVGQPQAISAPAAAKPLSALTGRQAGGAAAPAPGASKVAAYSRCLKSAGADPAGITRCLALLR